MSAADFFSDLPVADVQIGPKCHCRIYGDPELGPPLVEWRIFRFGYEDILRLTVDQADELSRGLARAAAKARGDAP